MKIVTENMKQSTTLWTTTAPEVRYLSYIDHIDPESCAPVPTCKLYISPPNSLVDKPIIIMLERKGETIDPRPEHGMYKQILRPITPETLAVYAEEDTADTLPFIIENNGKTLSYVPDKVADELVNNLIQFLDKCDAENIPVEVKIDMQEATLTPQSQLRKLQMNLF